MIDRALIDTNKLLDVLLDTNHGNFNQWLRLVEIVPDYMPPFPGADTRPTIQVRCLVNLDEPPPAPGVATGRYLHLRAAGISGWRAGGYFWDLYGSNFVTVECALLAVIHAPVPPSLLKPIAWSLKEPSP